MAFIHSSESEYLSPYEEKAPNIKDEYLKLKTINVNNGYRYNYLVTKLFLEIFVEDHYPELFATIAKPKYINNSNFTMKTTENFSLPPSLYIFDADKWWSVASALTHLDYSSKVIDGGVKVKVKTSVEFNCLTAFLPARDIKYIHCTLGVTQDSKCRCRHEGDVIQKDQEGNGRKFTKPAWNKSLQTPDIPEDRVKVMPEYRGWFWSQIFPDLSETIVADICPTVPDAQKLVNSVTPTKGTSKKSKKILNLEQSFTIIEHLLGKIDLDEVQELGNKIFKSKTRQDRIDILVGYSEVLQSIHNYTPPTKEEIKKYNETGYWE